MAMSSLPVKLFWWGLVKKFFPGGGAPPKKRFFPPPPKIGWIHFSKEPSVGKNYAKKALQEGINTREESKEIFHWIEF